MELVKVRIKEGYMGHYHMGKLCEPGDIIEVTPQRAAWLHKIGATEPVRASRKKEKTASIPEEETPEEEVTTEGAEETPEES